MKGEPKFTMFRLRPWLQLTHSTYQNLKLMKVILFILIFLLCSCHTSHPEEATITEQLSLWHAYRGEERVLLEQLLVDFEKEEGIKVKALSLPHSAFANKVQVAIPRGNGPDVLIFAHDRIGDRAEAGLVPFRWLGIRRTESVEHPRYTRGYHRHLRE